MLNVDVPTFVVEVIKGLNTKMLKMLNDLIFKNDIRELIELHPEFNKNKKKN